MRSMLATITTSIVALACIGFAGYLVIQGKGSETWGWFLFVGFLCAGSVVFPHGKE